MPMFEMELYFAAGLKISNGQTLPLRTSGLWGMEMPPQPGCSFSTRMAALVVCDYSLVLMFSRAQIWVQTSLTASLRGQL